MRALFWHQLVEMLESILRNGVIREPNYLGTHSIHNPFPDWSTKTPTVGAQIEHADSLHSHPSSGSRRCKPGRMHVKCEMYQYDVCMCRT